MCRARSLSDECREREHSVGRRITAIRATAVQSRNVGARLRQFDTSPSTCRTEFARSASTIDRNCLRGPRHSVAQGNRPPSRRLLRALSAAPSRRAHCRPRSWSRSEVPTIAFGTASMPRRAASTNAIRQRRPTAIRRSTWGPTSPTPPAHKSRELRGLGQHDPAQAANPRARQSSGMSHRTRAARRRTWGHHRVAASPHIRRVCGSPGPYAPSCVSFLMVST